MSNPLSTLITRCSRGFTLPQKIGITVLVILFTVSPLDCIPDVIPVLGWVDDGFLLFLLRRVWASPTLPPPNASGGNALAR